MSLYYRAAVQPAHRPTAHRYYSDNYLTLAIKNAGIKFAGIVFIAALSLLILANGPQPASDPANRLNPTPTADFGPPGN